MAFSIYGKVQDFNKDGVEGVVVEAYHLNNPANTHPKETSTTDKYGNYRIRGIVNHIIIRFGASEEILTKVEARFSRRQPSNHHSSTH